MTVTLAGGTLKVTRMQDGYVPIASYEDVWKGGTFKHNNWAYGYTRQWIVEGYETVATSWANSFLGTLQGTMLLGGTHNFVVLEGTMKYAGTWQVYVTEMNVNFNWEQIGQAREYTISLLEAPA